MHSDPRAPCSTFLSRNLKTGPLKTAGMRPPGQSGKRRRRPPGQSGRGRGGLSGPLKTAGRRPLRTVKYSREEAGIPPGGVGSPHSGVYVASRHRSTCTLPGTTCTPPALGTKCCTNCVAKLHFWRSSCVRFGSLFRF